MEKAISVLTQFHTSKEGIGRFVNQVVSEVRDGVYNPLQLKIVLKAIQKSCEEIEKQTNDLSIFEAEKYGKKSFDMMDVRVEVSELGTKYDFSNCNHPELIRIEGEIKKLSAEKKRIELFMKTITESMVICNVDTGGEHVEINPPIKSSTTGLKITFK